MSVMSAFLIYNRHFNGLRSVFVAREMPAANLKALSPAPLQTPARTPAANAHSVHAVGDSAEQEGA